MVDEVVGFDKVVEEEVEEELGMAITDSVTVVPGAVTVVACGWSVKLGTYIDRLETERADIWCRWLDRWVGGCRWYIWQGCGQGKKCTVKK